MDGLMFDTEHIAQLAWRRAASDFGFDFSDQIFRDVIGRTIPDVERFAYQAFGEDFPFGEVYRRKQAYVQRRVMEHGIPLKPGLVELLDVLAHSQELQPLSTAVASSSAREIIDRNLRLAGLPVERFDVLAGGDEVENGKPAPDIFLLASRKLGILPDRCLVLEDSNAGIKAAHAAGMIPVMIPDLVPPSEEAVALSYKILPSLHAVEELIIRDLR
jgi:beta-phosphoglucomutase-like phosphatase (HAD superfamily)